MRGNSHVRFLGRSDPATGRSYPTGHAGARGAQSRDGRDNQGGRRKEADLRVGEGTQGRIEQVIRLQEKPCPFKASPRATTIPRQHPVAARSACAEHPAEYS